MKHLRLGTALELATNSGAVAVTKLKGVFLIVIMTRAMGVEAYGVWAQVQVLAELGAIITNLGLPNALIRFYPEREADTRRTLIWTTYLTVFSASLLMSIVFGLGAGLLATVFGRGRADTPAFVAAGIVTPALALRLVMLTIWRAENRLQQYSLGSIATDLGELALVGFTAAVSRSLVAVSVSYAITVWAEVILLFTVHWKRSGGMRRPHGLKRLLRYSLPVVPSALSMEGLARGDRLIVGALAGAERAGLYSSLYAIASSLTLVSQPFTNVLFPKVVKRGPDAVRSMIRRFLRSYLLVSLPVLVALISFAAPLTSLTVGSDADPDTARAVIALSGSGILLLGAGRIHALWFFASDQTRTFLYVTSTAVVLNVLLNFILVPVFDVTGAALATLLSYGGYVLLQSVCTRKGARRR